MDDTFFLMDVFPIHAAPLKRAFPSLCPAETIGYHPRKQEWVRRAFNTYNFSFILKGGGEYRLGGKLWSVNAPCVITQSPGVYVEYGPAGAWTEWEELYLIYNRAVVPALERAGLIRRNRPVWRIHDPVSLRECVADLLAIAAQPETSGFADRLDRACERLILESILAEFHQPASREEEAIGSIRAFLKAHYLEDHDFNRLAAQHGMSRSAFRRHWDQYVEMPPGRYVMNLRLRQACRLLVETRLTISEIAAKLSFQDPLYFSRKFHKALGVPASEYRHQHQVPLPLVSRPAGSGKKKRFT